MRQMSMSTSTEALNTIAHLPERTRVHAGRGRDGREPLLFLAALTDLKPEAELAEQVAEVLDRAGVGGSAQQRCRCTAACDRRFSSPSRSARSRCVPDLIRISGVKQQCGKRPSQCYMHA
jgi:hypothetical protein